MSWLRRLFILGRPMRPQEQAHQPEQLFVLGVVPVTVDDILENTDRPWAVKLRESRYVQDFTGRTDPASYCESIRAAAASVQT